MFFVSLVWLNGFSQNVGIGTTTPKARLHVADSNVVFTGPSNVSATTNFNPPVQGPGTRMMWYPQKAAFRVGMVTGTQWDKDSIGLHSFAAGLDSKAKGIRSFAIGNEANASGDSSIALGTGPIASGLASTAIGFNSFAEGLGSTTLGVLNKSSKDFSFSAGYQSEAAAPGSIAIGFSATTTGDGSVAIGPNAFAGGHFSTAFGAASSALGDSSIAIGTTVTASKLVSTAIGYNTKAQGLASTAIGVLNTSSKDFSFSAGYQSEALGLASIAIGFTNTASGDGATAIGASVVASGYISTAFGGGSYASGDFSVAMGELSSAYGHHSIAMGKNTLARGDYSMAIGNSTLARSPASLVIGNFNDTASASSLFEIGNGTANNARKNALTVLSNGNVGIGKTNPSLKFEMTLANSGSSYHPNTSVGVESNSHHYINLITNNNSETGILFGNGISYADGGITYTPATGSPTPRVMNFRTANTTTMTLYSNGNLGIAGSLFQNSDMNLKKNITPLSNSLSLIQQLHGYTYSWKDEKRDNAQQIGLLAQELQKVYPELVKENADGNLSVNYIGLIPVLLESIKELKKEIEELKLKK